MREPYPVALVPLLQQFLNRRRAKSDFPLRAMEKLGLDRPAYLAAIDLGVQDPRGALPVQGAVLAAGPARCRDLRALAGPRRLPHAGLARRGTFGPRDAPPHRDLAQGGRDG